MFKFLGKLSDIVSSLAVAAIVMITILAVFMRWLLNDPLMWSEEVLIICYIWLVMIGAALPQVKECMSVLMPSPLYFLKKYS
ncbi:TRAP transporter small permease subunit [Providencia rettgeri]|nr:TRAP transporter small permease subunit [Providencia rettgeri]